MYLVFPVIVIVIVIVIVLLQCLVTSLYTVAEYSWSIANNLVIGVYCRCLEILCQIAFSSLANYFRSYRKKHFVIKAVGIYSRRL